MSSEDNGRDLVSELIAHPRAAGKLAKIKSFLVGNGQAYIEFGHALPEWAALSEEQKNRVRSEYRNNLLAAINDAVEVLSK